MMFWTGWGSPIQTTAIQGSAECRPKPTKRQLNKRFGHPLVQEHAHANRLQKQCKHTFLTPPRATARTGLVHIFCIQIVRFPCGVPDVRHLHGIAETQNVHPNCPFPMRRAPFGSFAGLAGTQSFASKLLSSRASGTFCVFCVTLPARKIGRHPGAKLLSSRAARAVWAFCITLLARKLANIQVPNY